MLRFHYFHIFDRSFWSKYSNKMTIPRLNRWLITGKNITGTCSEYYLGTISWIILNNIKYNNNNK